MNYLKFSHAVFGNAFLRACLLQKWLQVDKNQRIKGVVGGKRCSFYEKTAKIGEN